MRIEKILFVGKFSERFVVVQRHVYIPEEQPDELLVVVLDGPVDGCEAGEVADGGGEGGAGGQLAPHRRHVAAAEVQQPRDVRLGPLPLAPSQGLAGHLGPGEQGGCSKELLNTIDYFHFKTRPLHALFKGDHCRTIWQQLFSRVSKL